jgi:hypothetical protein
MYLASISIQIYPLVHMELWVENNLVLVTITSDRAANLDICLALTAFSSGGYFTCHTHCDTGPRCFRSDLKDL